MREEHRLQPDPPEDVHLAEFLEHLHLGTVRLFRMALVGAQLEQARTLLGGLRRNLEARHLCERREHGDLAPLVDGISGRRVDVGRAGLQELGVLEQARLHRRRGLERAHRHEQEVEGVIAAGYHFERADRLVAQPLLSAGIAAPS